jgi:hypothetical protein
MPRLQADLRRGRMSSDTLPGLFRRYNRVAEIPAVTNSAHAKSFDQSPLPHTRVHNASGLALARGDEKERVPCRYRGSFRMHRRVERRPAARWPPDCDEPGALELYFLEPHPKRWDEGSRGLLQRPGPATACGCGAYARGMGCDGSNDRSGVRLLLNEARASHALVFNRKQPSLTPHCSSLARGRSHIHGHFHRSSTLITKTARPAYLEFHF